jgi:hypothetical protein
MSLGAHGIEHQNLRSQTVRSATTGYGSAGQFITPPRYAAVAGASAVQVQSRIVHVAVGRRSVKSLSHGVRAFPTNALGLQGIDKEVALGECVERKG